MHKTEVPAPEVPPPAEWITRTFSAADMAKMNRAALVLAQIPDGNNDASRVIHATWQGGGRPFLEIAGPVVVIYAPSRRHAQLLGEMIERGKQDGSDEARQHDIEAPAPGSLPRSCAADPLPPPYIARPSFGVP